MLKERRKKRRKEGGEIYMYIYIYPSPAAPVTATANIYIYIYNRLPSLLPLVLGFLGIYISYGWNRSSTTYKHVNIKMEFMLVSSSY